MVSTRSPAFTAGSGFTDDALEREVLAKKLSGYVDRLSEGAVIGLSGEWGSGKTWFGRRWCELLSADHKTIFLDAFENDYSDDAFVVIASHILRALDRDKALTAELWQASKKIGVALLPVTAKVAVTAGVRLLTGMSGAELADEVAKQVDEAGGKTAEKFVEERLRHHEEAQKGVIHFRQELEKLCAAQAKPVVFFIDELDRCRPHFAVQMIERIKHFFDVKNLVFVLLLNRGQLEKAIEGVYGPIDAAAYLHKFIHFFLTLPSPAYSDDEGFGRQFCMQVAKRNGLTEEEANAKFVQAMMCLVPKLRMTLRDIERAFIVFAMSTGIRQGSPAAAYLCGVKVKEPDVFAGISSNQTTAHQTAAKKVKLWHEQDADYWMWSAIYAMHQHSRQNINELSPEERQLLAQLGMSLHVNQTVGAWLRTLAQRLDLPAPE